MSGRMTLNDLRMISEGCELTHDFSLINDIDYEHLKISTPKEAKKHRVTRDSGSLKVF
jgi:hypothetical protein